MAASQPQLNYSTISFTHFTSWIWIRGDATFTTVAPTSPCEVTVVDETIATRVEVVAPRLEAAGPGESQPTIDTSQVTKDDDARIPIELWDQRVWGLGLHSQHLATQFKQKFHLCHWTVSGPGYFEFGDAT